MNALEHELNYPLQTPCPPRATALPVADGVRWIRMALPFALNHINLWLLRDEIDGVAGLDRGGLLHRPRREPRAVGRHF